MRKKFLFFCLLGGFILGGLLEVELPGVVVIGGLAVTTMMVLILIPLSRFMEREGIKTIRLRRANLADLPLLKEGWAVVPGGMETYRHLFGRWWLVGRK